MAGVPPNLQQSPPTTSSGNILYDELFRLNPNLLSTLGSHDAKSVAFELDQRVQKAVTASLDDPDINLRNAAGLEQKKAWLREHVYDDHDFSPGWDRAKAPQTLRVLGERFTKLRERSARKARDTGIQERPETASRKRQRSTSPDNAEVPNLLTSIESAMVQASKTPTLGKGPPAASSSTKSDALTHPKRTKQSTHEVQVVWMKEDYKFIQYLTTKLDIPAKVCTRGELSQLVLAEVEDVGPPFTDLFFFGSDASGQCTALFNDSRVSKWIGGLSKTSQQDLDASLWVARASSAVEHDSIDRYYHAITKEL